MLIVVLFLVKCVKKIRIDFDEVWIGGVIRNEHGVCISGFAKHMGEGDSLRSIELSS